MRLGLARVALLVATLATRPAWLAAGETVDRIVAVAAGRAVTFTAAVADANCHAFLSGQPAITDDLSGPESISRLRPVIERLAEQYVIDAARQHAQLGSDFLDSALSRVDAEWARLSHAYPSPQQLQSKLTEYGLDEDLLWSRLLREQRILAYVDYALRPQVRLEPEAVEAYFREEFLPEWRRANPMAEPPDLVDVRAQVEEVLIQREENRLFPSWLEGLRREQEIRFLPEPEQRLK